MTTAEAQSLYDQAGTIDALAALLGMSRNLTYSWLKDHGVRLKKRGGWSKTHEKHRRDGLAGRRPGRAVSIHCRQENRPCVIHDLPGSCDLCKSWKSQIAGIRSLMECARVVR